MFKGTGTALITPFNEDYNVDLDDFKKIIKPQKINGTSQKNTLGRATESNLSLDKIVWDWKDEVSSS